MSSITNKIRQFRSLRFFPSDWVYERVTIAFLLNEPHTRMTDLPDRKQIRPKALLPNRSSHSLCVSPLFSIKIIDDWWINKTEIDVQRRERESAKWQSRAMSPHSTNGKLIHDNSTVSNFVQLHTWWGGSHRKKFRRVITIRAEGFFS